MITVYRIPNYPSETYTKDFLYRVEVEEVLGRTGKTWEDVEIVETSRLSYQQLATYGLDLNYKLKKKTWGRYYSKGVVSDIIESTSYKLTNGLPIFEGKAWVWNHFHRMWYDPIVQRWVSNVRRFQDFSILVDLYKEPLK